MTFSPAPRSCVSVRTAASSSFFLLHFLVFPPTTVSQQILNLIWHNLRSAFCQGATCLGIKIMNEPNEYSPFHLT